MENFLNNYNIITPILLTFLIIPIVTGLFAKISQTSIWISLASVLRVIEFITGIILSFYLTKKLFFEYKITVLENIKDIITQNIQISLNPETLIYLVVTPVIFIIIALILRLIVWKIEFTLLEVFAGKLFRILDSLWKPLNIFVRIILKITKAVFKTLFVCLLITVISLYSPSFIVSDQLEQSQLYSFINKYTIEPLLSSKYVQKIPVLLNESILQIDQKDLQEECLEGASLPQKLKNGIKIIWYFNGVTLEEAIKSNDEIDSFALKLVKDESNSKKKAKIIYRWIASHIKYDYDKAEKVTENSRDVSSGAIQAFNTRKGICFDSSALYVAMCRALGLKVRLVVGMGFNGVTWGEHAWNQVYIPEEKRWANVDTTFAIGGNYFDRAIFDFDHKLAKIAGEW